MVDEQIYMLKWYMQRANFHADRLIENSDKSDLINLKFFIRKAKAAMSKLERVQR
jgi:hypothetical protein